MMTNEVFRVLMEQHLKEWLLTLDDPKPDEAWCTEHSLCKYAVEGFLAWYDKKEMEL